MRQWANAHRPWVWATSAFLLCAVASLLAPAPKPVYAMDGQLVFTASNAAGSGNAFRADTSNMIFFAAAVERTYNVTPIAARVASESATLYGIGVRDGSRVSLPNSGGQWRTSFNRPALRVEVVSGSEPETRARFDSIVYRLRSIAEDRQQAAGVPSGLRVHLELNPAAPAVQVVSGSHTKQAGAGVVLGLLAAGGAFTLSSRRHSGGSAAQPVQAGVRKPLGQPLRVH